MIAKKVSALIVSNSIGSKESLMAADLGHWVFSLDLSIAVGWQFGARN